MMRLEDILNDIKALPTIMTAAQELELAGRLMRLSADDIFKEWATFRTIMGDLCLSHTDAVYEVDDLNRDQFFQFANWLESLEKSLRSKSKGYLEGCANNFRADPSVGP